MTDLHLTASHLDGTMGTDKKCRWGILGTSTIGRKNWDSIRNTGNAVVTAVASRDRGRAQSYIEELQRDRPFEHVPAACQYEELLARDDVDAVYIPLPTGVRSDWVIKAAQAGKHVMCEKPCAIDAHQLKKMVSACLDNRVQFMDGVMFMHSARLPEVRRVLDDGPTIGKIRRICTQFTFRAPEEFFGSNIRSTSQLEPHGALGDLGWYLIRIAIWAMNGKMPNEVTARFLHVQEDPAGGEAVPIDVDFTLYFDDGVSASCYASFLAENQQFVHISGTHGQLEMPDFVLPYYGCESAFYVRKDVFHVSGSQFNMEPHTHRIAVSEYSNNNVNAQETNLFRNFSNLVLQGTLDDFWPTLALKTQIVLDACMESGRQRGRPVGIPT